jgi:hypothetical protein
MVVKFLSFFFSFLTVIKLSLALPSFTHKLTCAQSVPFSQMKYHHTPYYPQENIPPHSPLLHIHPLSSTHYQNHNIPSSKLHLHFPFGNTINNDANLNKHHLHSNRYSLHSHVSNHESYRQVNIPKFFSPENFNWQHWKIPDLKLQLLQFCNHSSEFLY